MTRPIPVVLSAVLLGILAFLQLLSAGIVAAVGAAWLHHSMPGMPGPAELPPDFLPVLCFVLSGLYTVTSVWFLLTMAGLFRMRYTARYSMLIIAGLTTAVGAISLIASIARPFLMPSFSVAAIFPLARSGSGVYLFIGAISAIFTAIGIAQLIYFNRPGIGYIFNQILPPASFTTVNGRFRPKSIAVVSWYFMISSLFSLVYAVLPFPVILFGVPIDGAASHFTYAAFALISFGAGYALYRLRQYAPAAITAWMIFGVTNTIFTLTPNGHRSFSEYVGGFSAHGAAVASNTSVALLSALGGIAFNAFIVWLLFRKRHAFVPSPFAQTAAAELVDAPLPG